MSDTRMQPLLWVLLLFSSSFDSLLCRRTHRRMRGSHGLCHPVTLVHVLCSAVCVVVCTDLLPNIASMLSPADQSNLALTCKDFRHYINDFGRRAILISEGPARDTFHWRQRSMPSLLLLLPSDSTFLPSFLLVVVIAFVPL